LSEAHQIVKLISWNTNGRRDPEQQARALLGRGPDIVALQEVTAGSVASWVKAFEPEGLHVRSTVAVSSVARRGPHAYGVLIASRYPPGDSVRVSFDVPRWEEKVLSQLVETPLGEMAVHCVHVPPGSSNGWEKVEVLEAVHAAVSTLSRDRHTLLCGDFNTPKSELPSGEIITWAQHVDSSGRVRLRQRIRKRPGLRWDTAERKILSGLQAFGLRDVFRSLHGYEVDACSWIARRKDVLRPRRFDHIFASEGLRTVSCEYLSAWRECGLSDHAAIEAVFDLKN
jgi:exodeoxyribonuclease III